MGIILPSLCGNFDKPEKIRTRIWWKVRPRFFFRGSLHPWKFGLVKGLYNDHDPLNKAGYFLGFEVAFGTGVP